MLAFLVRKSTAQLLLQVKSAHQKEKNWSFGASFMSDGSFDAALTSVSCLEAHHLQQMGHGEWWVQQRSCWAQLSNRLAVSRTFVAVNDF